MNVYVVLTDTEEITVFSTRKKAELYLKNNFFTTDDNPEFYESKEGFAYLEKREIL